MTEGSSTNVCIHSFSLLKCSVILNQAMMNYHYYTYNTANVVYAIYAFRGTKFVETTVCVIHQYQVSGKLFSIELM